MMRRIMNEFAKDTSNEPPPEPKIVQKANEKNAAPSIAKVTKVSVQPPARITRICCCCGQMADSSTPNWLNMHKNIILKDGPQLWDWFTKFNGFQDKSLHHPNGDICQICLGKLVHAYKFHQQCLAVENIFQKAAEEPEEDLVGGQARKKTHNQHYFCDTCGETVLKKNKTKHSNAHKIECETCGKSFFNRLDLLQHVNMFHKKKMKATVTRDMIKCDKCHKTMDARSLRIHERLVHSEGKTKLCPICGKHFFYERELRWHIFKHSNPAPYQCAHCECKYASKDRMKHHLRCVHLKLRFDCKHCDKRFTKMKNLKNHILLRHEGAKLRCHICEIDTFGTVPTLQIHLKKHHQVNYDQSVNVVMANNEILIRSRTSVGTLIQTHAPVANES